MPFDQYDPNFGRDEIVQAEVPEAQGEFLASIPVTINGPVHNRPLSARAAGMRSYTMSTTTAQKIATRDTRRKRILITAVDTSGSGTSVALGVTKNDAEGVYAFKLPLFQVSGTTATSIILELTTIDELWAMANGAAFTVSIVSENWL